MASSFRKQQWKAKDEIRNESSSLSSSSSSSSSSIQDRNQQPFKSSGSRRQNAAEAADSTSGSTKAKASSREAKLLFVPYLPQDENGEDASEAQQVADISNSLLSDLLKMKTRDFWREVVANTSLHRFLDSYLHFRKRWYDVNSTKDDRVIVGDEQLSRRVFMVLLRMSYNKEPGAGSADYLSAQEHAAVLLEKRLFTVPKLIDICALYGHDNAELTSQLVSNVFKSQPAFQLEVSNAVPHFLTTIKALHNRTVEGVNRSGSSSSSGSSANPRLRNELLEVVSFVYDAVAALNAFIEIYPPACTYLLPAREISSRSAENIFPCIAAIQSLLLILPKGFAAVGGTSEFEAYAKRLKPLLVHLSRSILSKGYIEEVMDPGLKGRLLVQAMVALADGDVTSSNTILHSVLKDDFAKGLQELVETSSIVLDDNQYATILSLLPDTRPPAEQSYQQLALPSRQETDEVAAVRQSQIAQIKDLFPDYGDGFLSACLEAYDDNAEVVIQHILEGTLHSDLMSLDFTMEKPLPSTSSRSATKDKGKGKAVLDQPPPKVSSSSSSSSSAPQQQGRFVRRNQTPDADAKKLLNVRDDALSMQTVRLAMLYDDEYDDSFDDLGVSVGAADMEADSLVDLVSRKKKAADDVPSTKDGLLPPPGPASKPAKSAGYFMKDGKLYNYKVAGSVAVSSVEEGEALKKQEEETIYGLGRGGNVPHNAPHSKQQQARAAENEDDNEPTDQERRTSTGSRKFRRDRAMHKHMAALRG